MQHGRFNPADIPSTPEQVSVFIESGKMIFRVDGFDLYVSDKDSAGKSNCTGACAATWRPVIAPSDATNVSDWTLVTRSDQSRQWAYKGRPVYTLNPSAAATIDRSGWHIVSP